MDGRWPADDREGGDVTTEEEESPEGREAVVWRTAGVTIAEAEGE